MVVETFTHGPAPVYARASERGRMLPDGLVYVESWIDERRLDRCFQLMETDDAALFEVVPVIDSGEAAARVRARTSDTRS
jgi:hypothetical protein